MKVRDLLRDWQQGASSRLTARDFHVQLPLHDAARVLALTELFPGRTETQLITELLSAALDELEAAFPYVPGQGVVSEDDHGDPIYEDSGLTPRFYRLTQRHVQALEQELAGHD